jgi:hypothetical protein
VGSKTYDGVQFFVYVKDHGPRHVHGFHGEVEVIVDLLADGKVRQSDRWDAVTPPNGKRSDIRRILRMAAANVAELNELWEKTHGTAS